MNHDRLLCASIVFPFLLTTGTAQGTPGPSELLPQAYLKAATVDPVDSLGESLGLSGNTLVVGVRGEDSASQGPGGNPGNNAAINAGAALVFVRDAGQWVQQAYLKASNAEELDAFGNKVAIDGDTLVVAAFGEDGASPGVNGVQANNGMQAAGAVYVFVRQGGVWTQEAYLKASNPDAFDQFGQSVALSGDTLVVGAFGERSSATAVNGNQADNSLPGAGAAYVFRRTGTTWTQEAYLKASNTQADDVFGVDVDIDGDLIVVGAYREDGAATGVNGSQGNGAPNAGAAYVYRRSGSSWTQEAYLKASNTEAGDGFGQRVSVSGDTVVVTAAAERSAAAGINGDQADNSLLGVGAAYVFVHDGGSWSQEAYVKASNPDEGDLFYALDLDGDRLVVCATQEDSMATNVNGDEADDSALDSGAGYLFERTGGVWSQVAYLKASNTGAGDSFGFGVALSGERVAVGARLEDSAATGVDGDGADNSSSDSGAVYVFEQGWQAVSLVRNAGANPMSYTAGPVSLAGTFAASVDNTLSGQGASLLFAFDSAGAIALPGGQTLLCVDSGSGELFSGGGLAPTTSIGGVDQYALGIPPLRSLAGVTFCSQAVQFGTPPFTLSNAVDHTVGGF